jgi:hypothetical protein
MMLPWQLYLGVGAALAGIAWLLINTHDPRIPAAVPTPPKTRRDELLDARARCHRQLEILKSPERSRDYTGFSAEAAERLQAILEEIEEELKEGS